MSLKILIDMNLSPDWVAVFAGEGWSAVHWSAIGDPRATDSVIMDWAHRNRHVVFTHDLDFGTLLALTKAKGPSVIQFRAQDVFPDRLQQTVIAAIKQSETVLNAGALLVVDESKSRVRFLPFGLP